MSRLAKLRSFVADDHRYVFLATSAVATVGIWFSLQKRSQMSFLRGAYAVEVAMYWFLMAWLAVSAAAFPDVLSVIFPAISGSAISHNVDSAAKTISVTMTLFSPAR